MIKGVFDGFNFSTNEEGVVCEDKNTKEKLEKLYDYSNFGMTTSDGDPEYHFYKILELCGAENLSYKNTEKEGVVY